MTETVTVVTTAVNGDSQRVLELDDKDKRLLEHIHKLKAKLEKEIQDLKNDISELTKDMEVLEATFTESDSKNSARASELHIGRKKFNMSAPKGIDYLESAGLLNHTCQDIAQFLSKMEGLSKIQIGEYLGENKEFNLKVLNEFVRIHVFSNLSLVDALRQLLASFRLPGEAQKIDRMMECFAQHYCTSNPGVFTNSDTCYVVSFSVIMLNTTLHNPSVKEKTTLEQFISMNRGINNGGDLPRELLVTLFEDIKSKPFKIPEDDGSDLTYTFFNPDREGWLVKEGGNYKSWRRRWFILTDNCLYYFRNTTDKEPRGIIPLENLNVRDCPDSKRPFCFEIFSSGVIKACKTDSDGRVVEGNHSVYRIAASNVTEKDEWMKSIQASISNDPFYEKLRARKKKASNAS
ncbi:Cytohesin-1 [Trichoplax sp. H2]|nr:Cytohesin-1 [Trichoplax sp. H2]|eukprot:RDD42053.1 Cytohesin-1 [Trichoplax sp. H2]